MAASLRACVPPTRFYKLYAVHFGLIPNLSFEFVELLLGDSFCQMFILHHAFDIQILHDYLGWLGFHYLSRCLVYVIISNVGQPFVKELDFSVLPLNISALSERSIPYRTAILVVTLDVGFQLTGGFSFFSPQFLFQTPNFSRLVDVLVGLRSACVLIGNDRQFLYAKVDANALACQFSIFLLCLVGNRQIPMLAVIRYVRIDIMFITFKSCTAKYRQKSLIGTESLWITLLKKSKSARNKDDFQTV